MCLHLRALFLQLDHVCYPCELHFSLGSIDWESLSLKLTFFFFFKKKPNFLHVSIIAI